MKPNLLLQTGILFLIYLTGEALARLLPLPASVLGMALLFLLLLFGRKSAWIEDAADFLLKNMAFFFIPAGVGILTQIPVLRENLLPLCVICVSTTLVTFLVTAFTVRLVCFLQDRFREKGGAR